jgi:SOS response regulatory protein OraA/RecX
VSDIKKGLKTEPDRKRLFEVDTQALQALRLIAAPDPKDDLTDEELTLYLRKHKFSPDTIRQIVETVKSL